MFGYAENDKNVENAKLNPDIVGKSPLWIAKNAGIKIPKDTTIIGVNCKEVGEKEPLSREKLSPVLAFFKVKNEKEGFEKAEQMVNFNGLGHSAAIHCKEIWRQGTGYAYYLEFPFNLWWYR